MSFGEMLNDVKGCAGVLAAAIADRDGIPVESVGAEETMEELVAEFSTFLREVGNASRELDLGDLDQLMVAGADRVVMVTSITDEYFLVALVDRGGNPGRARYVSRLTAFRLRHEFV